MEHWSKFDIPQHALMKMSAEKRRELGLILPGESYVKKSVKHENDTTYSNFPLMLKSVGLPVPTAEHRFAPPRRWRWDFCWIEQKLALEIDGGVWTRGRHTRGKGFIKDMEKQNAGTMLGWHLFRVTPEQVKSGYAVALVKEWFDKFVT